MTEIARVNEPRPTDETVLACPDMQNIQLDRTIQKQSFRSQKKRLDSRFYQRHLRRGNDI